MSVDRLPFFSIIIPTRNRPASLARCLEAVAGLAYPHDGFEVIVVDDGSDPALQVDADRMPVPVTLIAQPPGGPAAARNRGVAAARGDVLAFTADDCIPERDWLQALAACCRSSPRAAFGGRVTNGLPGNICSQASHLITEYLVSPTARLGKSTVATPNNLAMPRDLYQSVGGFDPAYAFSGEDRDFCDRWQRHGFLLLSAPEAVVSHWHPLTLLSFVRQQFRYGRGSSQFRGHRSGRSQLEDPVYYWRLITYPFARDKGVRAVVLCLLVLASQIAVGAAFAATWRERRRRTRSPDRG